MRGTEDRWAGSRLTRCGQAQRSRLLKCLGRYVQLICAVKADAYGHGAGMRSPCCRGGANQLAVATVLEGVELREAGFDAHLIDQ